MQKKEQHKRMKHVKGDRGSSQKRGVQMKRKEEVCSASTGGVCALLSA